MNRSSYKYPFFIVLLWFAFYFLPIGNRGLWNPDEPRYLQVAWEMAQGKAYLVPIFNGELYAHKPPLFFWLTILMSNLSAFETASRYVSALMSLGTIFLTYLIGKRFGGQKIGFVAALILMTCGLYLWLTGTGNIDTTLTFFTTLSFFSFIRYEENKKWFWIVLAYLSCGFGALAKGPVALLIPWLVFIVWTSYSNYLKKEKVPYLYLIWGPFITFGVAAIWLIPACIAGGEAYARELLITHNIGRTVKSFAHQSPWYYYLINFPGIFAPWSVVFLGALYGFKKELKESNRPLHFYLIWFCTTFLFFSFFSGKRGQYLLPAYPAFSLFLAHVISRWDDREEFSFSIKLNVFIFFGIGTFLFLLTPFLPFFNEEMKLLADLSIIIKGWRLWAIYSIGILPIIMLWLSYAKLKKKKNMEACMVFSFAVMLYLSVFQVSIIPAIDSSKSVKYFVNDIKGKIPKDRSLAFFTDYSQSGWNFYLNRQVIPVIQPEEAGSLKPPFDFVLSEQKYHARPYLCMNDNPSKESIDYYGYKIVSTRRIGSKAYTLWELKAAH